MPMKHALRLARFVAPYRLKIAAALCALVVAAGCVLALGQGLKHVVDMGFGSGSAPLLDAALAAMIGVAALLSAAVGIIVGLPALRLKGIYLAIATIAFPDTTDRADRAESARAECQLEVRVVDARTEPAATRPAPTAETSPAPSDAGTIRLARFFEPRATSRSR